MARRFHCYSRCLDSPMSSAGTPYRYSVFNNPQIQYFPVFHNSKQRPSFIRNCHIKTIPKGTDPVFEPASSLGQNAREIIIP